MLSRMMPGLLFALVCCLMSGYFMILFIFPQFFDFCGSFIFFFVLFCFKGCCYPQSQSIENPNISIPVSVWNLPFSLCIFSVLLKWNLISMNVVPLKLDPSCKYYTFSSFIPDVQRQVVMKNCRCITWIYLACTSLHSYSFVSVGNVCLVSCKDKEERRSVWQIEYRSCHTAVGKDALLVGYQTSFHLQLISLLFRQLCLSQPEDLLTFGNMCILFLKSNSIKTALQCVEMIYLSCL